MLNTEIPKHSLVNASHLHWLSVKLPEIYAMECSELEYSLRSWVCEAMVVRGLLFESSCTSASFDSSVNACVSIPV